MPKHPDENDRARGVGPPLPADPFDDAVPMLDPKAEEARVVAEAERRRLLSPWHVRAVLAELLEVRGEVEYIAPLPGGVYPSSRGGDYPPAHLSPTTGDRPGWPGVRALLGGWRPDTVAVLVGHTGRGKSSFAVQVAEEAARARGGAPVLYASLEMGAVELLARMLAMRGRDGVRWADVKRGKYPREAVREAGERLVAEAPHLYLWAPRGREERTVEALERMARTVCAEAGRPPLVVLDYVQRLADPSTEERRGAVSELSARLRDLSRPDPAHGWPGCAVLALSSVGRAHYATFAKCDTLASATDLEGTGKESGELEYDAPVVLALTSDTDDDGAMVRQALLRVVKNREGSPGKVWMRFDAPRGLFREGEAPSTGRAPAAGVAARKPGPRYASDDA
jgi:hypothetical protein